MARLHHALLRRNNSDVSTVTCKDNPLSKPGRRPLLEGLETRTLLSTWTVNTLDDPATFDTGDSVVSLREAISSAVSGDAIHFSTSLNGTITLQNGQLQILGKDLAIVGPGASQLTLSGNGASRVLDIETGNVTLSGLTIANGNSIPNGGGIYTSAPNTQISDCVFASNASEHGGGGIFNAAGSVTLTNCIFKGNSAPDGSGGGLLNNGTATLTGNSFSFNHAASGGGISTSSGSATTLTNCSFDQNPATAGGGIASGGTLRGTGCTFTSNSADWGAGIANLGTATFTSSTISGNHGENGAGVRNLGRITLADCTISGNRAMDYGGAGLHNTGAARLYNCTLTANTAYSGGGGAIRNSSSASLTISYSTISGNSAASSMMGGGGILNAATSTVILNNTIVSGNTAEQAFADISGNIDPSSSHNLIGVGGGLTNGMNGNIVGVTDPKLGSLASNGGPTQTMALLPGSPALNAGGNSLVPSGQLYDQRGSGYARISGGTIDIGAYEEQAPVAQGFAATTQENTAKVLTLSGSDADGDSLGFIITSLPQHGTLYDGSGTTGTLITAAGYHLGGNQLTYVPTSGWNSSAGTPDNIGFQVSDGILLSAPAIASITVTTVNTAPVRLAGTVGPISVKAGWKVSTLGLAGLTYGPGGGADEAGQTLTYRVTAVPALWDGIIFLANGTRVKANTTYTLAQIRTMVFVPTLRPCGTYLFQFTVQDNGGTANGGVDTLLETLSITVLPKCRR